MNTDLSRIDTEQRNPRTAHIDTLSTLEMAALINQEDHRCAEAVKAVLPEIARSVDLIYDQLCKGGRLFYCGAGTSGRLGVLDAAECPPTYGVDPGLVIGLIAVGIMSAKMKTVRSQSHASDYVRPGSMQLTNQRDIFLYSHVSRRAKPKQTSSGGSRGGGSRGGAGGRL